MLSAGALRLPTTAFNAVKAVFRRLLPDGIKASIKKN